MGQVFVKASRRAKAYVRSSKHAAQRANAISAHVHSYTTGHKRITRSAKRQAQLVALNDRLGQLAVDKTNFYKKKQLIGRQIFKRKTNDPFRSLGAFRLGK